MHLIINGEQVHPALIEQEVEAMRPHYQDAFRDQSADEQEKQLHNWAKENVIEKVLLRQEALRDPQPVDPAKIQSEYDSLLKEQGGQEAFLKANNLSEQDIEKVKKDIEGQIRMQRLAGSISKEAGLCSEAEAKAHYMKNVNKFLVPEQVHAAHIVVHTDAQTSVMQAKVKIMEIEQELSNGRSFEELADETSDCPGNGGDLGYFPRGHMVQNFEDVVFSMQPNQISAVFQTEFGFHIAKVIDKRPERLAPFEQVKNQLIEQLTKEKQGKALEDYLDELKAKADIREIEDDSSPDINKKYIRPLKPLNSVLVKPSGPDCNLDCGYCFYLEKAELFSEQKIHRMSDQILEEMVKQVMTDGSQYISFGWQGGEPTLMGLPFFQKAVDFQKKIWKRADRR